MISINHVSFETGIQKILNDISFVVPQNTCAALLGPNGAGKSTLIDIITGAIHPSEGEVRVSGKSFKDIRKRAGILFENPPMFYYSKVKEIIFYICTVYGIKQKDIQPLIRTLGIHDIMNKLTRVLSKGEKKKVGLLISLAHHPEVLILDEPGSGMDPFFRNELWSIIRSWPSTILFTTHIWEEAAKYADNVIFISKGSTLCCDTPDNLLSQKYTGFSHKVTIPKTGHMMTCLEQMQYMEDENSIHIFSNEPGRVVEVLGSEVAGYSVSEISLMDVFMYLERRQK
ncbi:MAG: ABC transporter ATP-binding protein [Bacteroidota bacterium]